MAVVIPYAAFATSENTRAFLPVFKQAVLRRGLPERLYVDNGANYRSQHQICHRWPHHGLDKITPLEKWAKTGDSVQFPESGCDLDDLFLFELQRKVQKDRTVSLNGIVYEVDAALVGETVTMRFDAPF
ncbi:MAG: Mu transposase, C-terminal [Candidatus Kentron sp. G]|nr:MAG: Mu transposase, C-terminal [Candidatus Kentron sp. G]